MTPQGPHSKGILAKNSIFNLLGQILPMLVGILTIPYIVRGLGTDGYGILSIAYMVLGYFSIFDLGLSRATVKFVAEHLTPEKVQKVPELVWTSLSLLVMIGCVGGLLGASLVPVMVTRFFKMPPSFVGQARTSLFILCAATPILLGNDALRGVLEAAQRFDLVNYVKVPGSVCFYLLAALAIALNIHVTGIVFILTMVRLATACAYLVLALHVFPGLRNGFTISRTTIRQLASYGGWVMVSNSAGPIFGYLERFLIASILSVGMLTYYAAPYELVSKVIIFPASIAPTLFPYFSYYGNKGGSEVSDVSARSLKYLLLVMTPVTAVFVFFAKDILRLWLGPQFVSQSTVVLQLLAVVFFLNAFTFVPFTSVQALGRPDLKAILDIVALPTYAVTSWWLTRHMGINGAALAKVLISILDGGCLFLFAWKMRAFSFRVFISGPLLRALLASAGLLAVVFLVASCHPDIKMAICLLTVCFAGYTGMFWAVAADDVDKVTLRSLSHRLFARS